MNKRQRKKFLKKKAPWIWLRTSTGRYAWGQAIQTLPRDAVRETYEASYLGPFSIEAVYPGEDGIGADIKIKKE